MLHFMYTVYAVVSKTVKYMYTIQYLLEDKRVFESQRLCLFYALHQLTLCDPEQWTILIW